MIILNIFNVLVLSVIIVVMCFGLFEFVKVFGKSFAKMIYIM